MKPSVSNI